MIFEIVIFGQFSWFWYHSKALNETDTILMATFKLKFLKEIYNLIILIDNSVKLINSYIWIIFIPAIGIWSVWLSLKTSSLTTLLTRNIFEYRLLAYLGLKYYRLFLSPNYLEKIKLFQIFNLKVVTRILSISLRTFQKEIHTLISDYFKVSVQLSVSACVYYLFL